MTTCALYCDTHRENESYVAFITQMFNLLSFKLMLIFFQADYCKPGCVSVVRVNIQRGTQTIKSELVQISCREIIISLAYDNLRDSYMISLPALNRLIYGSGSAKTIIANIGAEFIKAYDYEFNRI